MCNFQATTAADDRAKNKATFSDLKYAITIILTIVLIERKNPEPKAGNTVSFLYETWNEGT